MKKICRKWKNRKETAKKYLEKKQNEKREEEEEELKKLKREVDI